MLNTFADSLQQFLAHQYPDATVSQLQFVTSGWETEVYSFDLHLPSALPRSLILRLYPGSEAVEKMNREAGGLRQLHLAGFPVPEIVFQETETATLGKPFTLMEKLEGGALWPILAAATSPQINPLLDRFGSLLARLHQLDWRPFTTSAVLYENDPAILLDEIFASWRQLYAQFGMMDLLNVVDWLENHNSEIAVQPALVHLDFHANNVFVCEDGRWAVIDWTQITVSDYRADLSWTLMLMGDFGQPQWGERILRAYDQAALRPVERLDYFNVITYAKLLAITVISLKAGPQALGLRPEAVASVQGQAPVLKKLLGRLQEITGIAFPGVEAALARFC